MTAPRSGLTRVQARTLDFIETYAREHNGVSPSYVEIAAAIGVKGKSGVNRIVVALEARGAIHRLAGRNRNIALGRSPQALVRLPDELHERLQRFCRTRGKSIEFVLADAVTLHLVAMENTR